MVKIKELSEETRNAIKVLSEVGKTQIEISKQLNIPQSTISRTLKRIKCTRSLKSLPRTSRPRKTTSRIDDKILRMAEISETPCAIDIANELANLHLANVHPNTVRNRLNEKDLHGRALAKKSLLSPRHCKARLEFAKIHQNWTEDAWSKVLWSDETKICLHGSDGRRWTWKRSGEALKPKHVKKTIKFEKSVMVWGCFSSAGVGDFYIITDIMTSAKYVRILTDHMIPSARRLIGSEFTF